MGKERLNIDMELEGTKEEIKEQVLSMLVGTAHQFNISRDEWEEAINNIWGNCYGRLLW